MSSDVSLNAVVFADLVGYSRLVAENEDLTLAFVDRCFDMLREDVAALDGDLVRTTGDGFIVLFRSASMAVQFAIRFHRGVVKLANDDSSKFSFRIGIHQGEVRRDSIDVYGHAVNVASRLEALADAGSTLVSGDIYREARRGVDATFVSRGIPVLKNIGERIATYQVTESSEESQPTYHDPLHINVLGGLSAIGPTGEVALPTTKSEGIVGSLALSAEHRETKATLATLLWPSSSAANARRALARSTRVITDLFDGEMQSAVAHNAEQIWLDKHCVVVDLDQMLEDGRAGKVDDRLIAGIDWEAGLLPQLDGISPLMDGWAKINRKHWRREFSDTLEGCLERYEAHEEGGRRAAIALLAMEPGHEPAARSLMRYHVARGNRVAALREFERLCDHLNSEFQIEPDQETLKLADDLRRGEQPHSTKKPSALMQRLRIMIGEFQHAGGTGSHRIFGFRAELIANLSKFREWTVLEAREDTINADGYLLRGDFQMFDEGGYLQLKLIVAPSQRIVWSGNYEIALEDWQSLQRQVVGKIAATLEVYVSADRLSQTLASPSVDQASFDDWLRGEQLLSRWTPEGDDEAEKIFQMIIDQDPSFAPAFASLASIHNVRHLIRPGLIRASGVDSSALDLCQRAIEIDPMDARNHLSVAWTAAMAGAFDQAVIHLDLATSLNPNSPKAAISAAMGNAFFGDIVRAVDLLEAAEAMTPMLSSEQWSYATAIRFLAGDDDGALKAAARSNDQIIDIQGWRAVALARQGQTNEASDAFTRLVAAVAPVWAGDRPATPQQVYLWFKQAFPFRRDKDRAAVAELLEKAIV